MKDKDANDNKSIKSQVSSDAVCSGSTPGKANPLPKVGPLPFADLVENAGQIQFVIVDKAKLQTETLEATVDYEGSVRKHRQLTTW